MRRAKRKCGKCGVVGTEVLPSGVRWNAGGNNCFHLEWHKDDSPLFTCETCEEKMGEDEYRTCDDCGALVCAHLWGAGYLPDDYDGVPLCPPCGGKKCRTALRGSP